MNTEERLLILLQESGAILKGHFRLSSGRHSDTYFEKFRVLEHPEVVSEICGEIAAQFSDVALDVVAGPTTGGTLIAFEVARQLRLPAIYVEREAGKRVIRRGAKIAIGARVLLVDDVLTTGGSLFEVIDLLKGEGAEVAGIAVLVDRSESVLPLPAPFYAAAKVEATSYAPDEIPEWLAAIPVSEPGTRNAG